MCKRLGNRLHCSGIDVGLFDAVGEKFQKVSFAVGMQKASEQISQISGVCDNRPPGSVRCFAIV
jgi:hypothetical protein